MRRALTLLMLVLFSVSLSAAYLELTVEGTLPAGYETSLRAGLHRLLSSRLEAEETLFGHLDEDLLLSLRTEAGSLAFTLPSEPEAVEAVLLSALGWDAIELMDLGPGARLSYPLSYGFLIEGLHQPRVGREYWAIDSDLRRRGSVRTMRVVGSDGSVVSAAQTSGGALLPHMRVVEMGTFGYGLYGSVSTKGSVATEVMVHQRLPFYPMEAHWGVGWSEGESFTVRVGLGATLALSHLVGTGTVVGRNLSIVGWVDLGAGWASGLLLSASARVGLSYHLAAWKISALVGTVHAATADGMANRGLFFTVGTAYTYTP
ncbi:MAG: hypothetical protein RBS49_02630 [Sphaerochaeta sp.]|jgi:hypothetical protein|nr:hypothetical protein [Sphaerochaeta sp.]